MCRGNLGRFQQHGRPMRLLPVPWPTLPPRLPPCRRSEAARPRRREIRPRPRPHSHPKRRRWCCSGRLQRSRRRRKAPDRRRLEVILVTTPPPIAPPPPPMLAATTPWALRPVVVTEPPVRLTNDGATGAAGAGGSRMAEVEKVIVHVRIIVSGRVRSDRPAGQWSSSARGRRHRRAIARRCRSSACRLWRWFRRRLC